jgi:hypothetical protein
MKTIKLTFALAVIAGLIGLPLLGIRHRPESPAARRESAAPPPPAPRTGRTPASGHRAPLPPPRFLAAPALPGESVLDPRSPGYDPVMAIRQGGRSLSELFAQEPRDPLWAPAREQQMRDVLSEPLVKAGSRIASAECRSFSCKLVLELPADRPEAITETIVGNVSEDLAIVVSPDREGFVQVTRLVATRPELRDADSFAVLLANSREARAVPP